MQYENLTDERKIVLIDQRIAQREQEHFHHELNIRELVASGDESEPTQAAIAAARQAQRIIEGAIASNRQEREKLRKAPKAKARAARSGS